MSPSERWALTPPFHPCQMPLTETGQPRLFPGACRRGVSGTWRYIFCGTFRSHVPKVCFRPPLSATPWRYQARCPFVVDPCEWTTNGVRTFLPSACRAKGSGPAITQLTRHVRLYALATGATIEPGLTIGHKGLGSCMPKTSGQKQELTRRENTLFEELTEGPSHGCWPNPPVPEEWSWPARRHLHRRAHLISAQRNGIQVGAKGRQGHGIPPG
jgi:hypothetical protein